MYSLYVYQEQFKNKIKNIEAQIGKILSNKKNQIYEKSITYPPSSNTRVPDIQQRILRHGLEDTKLGTVSWRQKKVGNNKVIDEGEIDKKSIEKQEEEEEEKESRKMRKQ